MKIHKLTLAALLVAIGTLSAHLIYIPAGISKCFPVQHAINVLGAGNFRPRLCDGSGLCHFLPAQYVRYRLTAGFSRQYDRRLSGPDFATAGSALSKRLWPARFSAPVF